MSQRAATAMPVGYGALTNKTTTINTYVEVGTVTVGQYKTKRLDFTVTTNNLVTQVLGSIDGGATFPFTVEDNIACNVGTTTKTYTDPYTTLKINVKPAVAATHGTLATRWFGAGW